MSWIFFVLLIGYGCIRLAFRLRGNLRYLRARRAEGPPRTIAPVPAHIQDGLADLFAVNETAGVEIDERRRVLAMLLHVDPDARFGEIRDGRYRRSVIEIHQVLGRWWRTYEALTEAEQQRAEDLGIGGDTVAAVRDRLVPVVRQVTRARALEPFPIEQVRAVHDGAVQFLDHADDLRRRLQAGEAHPYRGAAAAPCPRPSPSQLAAARSARAVASVEPAVPA